MNETWHKNAIIYGIDVAKFADSNGDGVGDFQGLLAKVPYLADLGVTCVWLLPIYPSPNRDNGYDIENYYSIHPKLGTLDDFIAFLHKAGEYGIQVILDLVINHTSDQHPWFKAARRDEGSRLRNYYVWANMPPPVPPEVGPVFPGEENSVWTYDEVARAFYFHRFYHFQPGLNYANPEVLREVRQIMDFWLSFGISGFRLDAAAPMIRKKGMPGTQPEDPHGVLRDIYEFLKERQPKAALVGEVDVAPSKLQSFFEGGGQMNLLFNFVLNNYLFLALARQEAEPILRAIRKLPALPEFGQWTNFLRNLDELDLERLMPEERQSVMDTFAPEETMRIFGRGIRRRLAPMLEGDQRRIELAFSLLFSLPGTPMLVYGDEIGMGEDLDRPGRAAVRAPMQWSGEKNAGFSIAPQDKLTQPMIAKGPFGYKQVNVEAQRGDQRSLLNRVRHMIKLRRQNAAIADSAWHYYDSSDSAVLVYGYNMGASRLLTLHNLADGERETPLDLGGEPVTSLTDLFSGEKEIFKGQTVRLEPYGYRWYILDIAQ